MTTENTKFADLLKNVSTIDKAKLLDQISASASSLPAADLKVLIQALSAEVRAQESKTSKKAARLAKLSAAMEATDNGTLNNVAVVRGELRRLLGPGRYQRQGWRRLWRSRDGRENESSRVGHHAQDADEKQNGFVGIVGLLNQSLQRSTFPPHNGSGEEAEGYGLR
jgi:hypothetical protein